jgi:hypothetical protein
MTVSSNSSALTQKLMNAGLIVTSLAGYLEWGGSNSSFLLEAELVLFRKLFSEPLSVLHPFTVLPLIGQVLLIATLFQARPGKLFTILGALFIGLLLLVIFAIGSMMLNWKMIASTVPFIVLAIFAVRHSFKYEN